MKITIKPNATYFKEGEKSYELKGQLAAPITSSVHKLIDQIRSKSPHLGRDLPHVDQIVAKVISREDGPANIELHYFTPGATKPRIIHLVDSPILEDSLEHVAKARYELLERIDRIPDPAATNSKFESTTAKVFRQAKHIRTAAEAAEDLVKVDESIEGAEKLVERFKGGLRLTAGFGVISTAISGLAAVEEYKTLQKQEGSLERRAEVITGMFAHITRGAAYGTAAAVGALELTNSATKTYRSALRIVPILSSVASLLEAFSSAIKFHTKRVFFSEANSRIRLASEGHQEDATLVKAKAIWGYVCSRVTCEEVEIEAKLSKFKSLSEAKKVGDLTNDFKKGLGWRFFSRATNEEKVGHFQKELFSQLEGLEASERSDLLNLMKKESIKRRVELAKSHDVEVITSKAVSNQLKVAVKSLNMDLRHHQWAAIGMYTTMEGEYKSNRYFEVASIVANIGSGIIGIAAVVVPGGIAIQIITGALSATDITSKAYLNRHLILSALNLSHAIDLDEQLERILDISKMRKMRRLS
jgi:hypothetical protein